MDSLQKAPYGLSMLHLRDPDTSGHAHGWDITSKSIYIYAVSKMDWIVGKLLQFIESNEKMKDMPLSLEYLLFYLEICQVLSNQHIHYA